MSNIIREIKKRGKEQLNRCQILSLLILPNQRCLLTFERHFSFFFLNLAKSWLRLILIGLVAVDKDHEGISIGLQLAGFVPWSRWTRLHKRIAGSFLGISWGSSRCYCTGRPVGSPKGDEGGGEPPCGDRWAGNRWCCYCGWSPHRSCH